MIEYLLKISVIFLASMFKFVAGPVLGLAAGLSPLEMVMVTMGGMMTTVVSLTFLGDWIKKYWNFSSNRDKKVFSPRSRNIVKVWGKYGPAGIAALTPLILTPVGGTIVMNAFRVKRNKIFTYMLVSALFWSLVFSFSIHSLLEIPLIGNLLK